MLTYQIISTGSDGNATIIDNSLLIDCGVPYSKLESYKDTLRYVFLTHEHTDHLNVSTLKNLANHCKHKLMIFAPYYLEDKIDLDLRQKARFYFIGEDTKLGNNELKFEAFPLVHNVKNVGYKIVYKGCKIIYATDTNQINHIVAQGYDYYFIECNHDYDYCIRQIAKADANGEYCHLRQSIKNHLSRDKFNEFISMNASSYSIIEPMHGSKTGLEH